EVFGYSDIALNSCLAELANQPFDLERGPLMRVHLLKRSPAEYVLLLAVHHIVVDYWSMSVLKEELGLLYSAERDGASADLAPLPLQYTDYVGWQANMLAGARGEELYQYW